jgi:hypothetical protein
MTQYPAVKKGENFRDHGDRKGERFRGPIVRLQADDGSTSISQVSIFSHVQGDNLREPMSIVREPACVLPTNGYAKRRSALADARYRAHRKVSLFGMWPLMNSRYSAVCCDAARVLRECLDGSHETPDSGRTCVRSATES